MNQEITILIKNRLSQSDFRKIDFDEPIDRFYYYGDHPVQQLAISNDDYITYMIKYYYCRKNDTRTVFEQKNLRIDMYRDKHLIVDFEKLKSEEKELFDSIVNDDYFQRIVLEDVYKTFRIHELKIATGM